MIALFYLMTLCLISFNAYADDNDAIIGTLNDKFQTIIDLSKQSDVASYNNIVGAYSGRCYETKERRTARNSALVVDGIPSNDGPLFPTEKAVVQFNYDGPVNIVDSKSKEDLLQDASNHVYRFLILSEYPLRVKLTYPHFIYDFFTYQNYILTLVSASQDGVYITRSGKIDDMKKDEVIYACYYFDKR